MRLPRRMSALLAGALLLLGFDVAPAQPRRDPAVRCQDALERGGHRFAREVLRSFARCAASSGEALADCFAPPAMDARVARTAARWHRQSARACAGVAPHAELGYLAQCAPDPSACGFTSAAVDAGGPRNDLVDCLACRIEDDIGRLTGALFAGRGSGDACHQALGQPGLRMVARMLDELRSCLASGDALSIAACLGDPERRARFASLGGEWRRRVAASCSDTDPIGDLGYPTLCSGVVPTVLPLCSDTAPACTFAPTTHVDRPGDDNDLLDCFACRTAETALGVARDLYGAEVCCTSEGCRSIRTRASCRAMGGRPQHYRIDEVPLPGDPNRTPPLLPGIANAHGIAVGADGTIYFPGHGGFAAVRADGSTDVIARAPRAIGTTVDRDGNVYGADRGGLVVRVTPDGVVSAFAAHPLSGQEMAGHSGDGGPAVAARINTPNGVTVDALGNVYITESGLLGRFFEGTSLTGEFIRMVDPAGIIHTVAGAGPFGVAGLGNPATSALLAVPYSLAVTARGSLLIGEGGAQRVVELESGGTLQPRAGRVPSPLGYYAGDGGPALDAAFYSVEGLAEDPDGKVAIADFRNGRIRLVDRLGSVITIAGTGALVQAGAPNGDGGPGAHAAAGCPAALAADGNGRFYYPDLQLDRLRVLTPAPY